MDKLAKRTLITLACLSFLAPAGIATPSKSTQQMDLHRLDFKIKGASCVGCLRRIGQTFRDTKGVLKADVSIYKPYWSIVIYDKKETNLDKLKEAIKKEKKVEIIEAEDKSITEVPVVLVPKGLTDPKPPAVVEGASGMSR